MIVLGKDSQFAFEDVHQFLKLFAHIYFLFAEAIDALL